MEDWNLFDFPKAEKFATQKFQEAQNLFAESHWGNWPSNPAKPPNWPTAPWRRRWRFPSNWRHFTPIYSSPAVAAPIVSSNTHSARGSTRRCAARSYREIATTQFDYIVVPVPWKQLQPEEHTFTSESVDEWVELLAKRRVPTVCVVWIVSAWIRPPFRTGW